MTKSGWARRVAGELDHSFVPIVAGFLARLGHRWEVGGIIPAGFQPGSNLVWRLGRAGQLRALDAQGKSRVRGSRFIRLVGVFRFGRAWAGLGTAQADGRMRGQVVQPEMPGLLANLALGRIAMLVQRLKIAKHTGNFFATDTKLLSIHKILHPARVKAGWARRGPRITTTSGHSQVS